MRGPFSFLLSALIGLSVATTRLHATPSTAGDNVIPQQVFDGMQANFLPAKAKGLHLRYQFNLSGPHGGQWWIEVNDGKFKMGRGQVANPNVVFITSDEDWVALSNGNLSGAWAAITGRLRVNGSHAIARKLDEMCP